MQDCDRPRRFRVCFQISGILRAGPQVFPELGFYKRKISREKEKNHAFEREKREIQEKIRKKTRT